MKSITFLVLMFILKQAFGQKPAIGVIKVESNFYLNKPIVLQGGIFPDSYGYNDFNYVDTNFTILNSVKPLLQDDKKYKIAVNTGYPHPFQFAYFDTVKLTGSSSFYFFIDNGITHVKLKDFSKEKYVLAG